jgi:hypothetical protein
MEKRNPDAIRPRHIRCARKFKLQVPPLRCASVGMTTLRAVAHLGMGGGGWTESAKQQPTLFRLRVCSLQRTHQVVQYQKATIPLIWAALSLPDLVFDLEFSRRHFKPECLRNITETFIA